MTADYARRGPDETDGLPPAAPQHGDRRVAAFNHLVDRVTTIREEASAGFPGVWSSASVKG